MQPPFTLTTADLKQVVDAAAPLIKETGMLPELEKILDFAQRAIPLIDQAAETIMKMRQFEAGGSWPAPDLIQMDNPNPERVMVEPVATPDNTSGTEGPSPRDGITAIKVYATLLASLKQLEEVDPEMSVTKALEMAREMKGVVLPEIEKELERMRSE